LVPNNSWDWIYIYDFSKSESVKTINWYQLIHVFYMFLRCFSNASSMFHTLFNLTLSSKIHYKNHRKSITKTSLRVAKVWKYESMKVWKYESMKVWKY
jgi:hypothetical protein